MAGAATTGTSSLITACLFTKISPKGTRKEKTDIKDKFGIMLTGRWSPFVGRASIITSTVNAPGSVETSIGPGSIDTSQRSRAETASGRLLREHTESTGQDCAVLCVADGDLVIALPTEVVRHFIAA